MSNVSHFIIITKLSKSWYMCTLSFEATVLNRNRLILCCLKSPQRFRDRLRKSCISGPAVTRTLSPPNPICSTPATNTFVHCFTAVIQHTVPRSRTLNFRSISLTGFIEASRIISCFVYYCLTVLLLGIVFSSGI